MVRLGAHIVHSAFAEAVFCHCRGALIEVAAVGCKGLGALRAYDVAEELALGLDAVREPQGVALLRGQGVYLLGPDSAQPAQGPGVAAKVHIVALVHYAAHHAGNKGPSGLYKGF